MVASAALVLVAAATLPSAASASASATRPIPTIWPGWTAFGDPTETGGRIVGAGGTAFSAGNDAFAAARGGQLLLGRFEGAGTASAVAVLPSGRLVAQAYDRVLTSDDLGGSWHAAALPPGPVVRRPAVFADARHGVVVDDATPGFPAGQPLPGGVRRGPGVLATDDGGRTWRTVVEPEPGPSTTRGVARTPVARPRTNDGGPSEPTPRVRVTAAGATRDGAFLRAITVLRAAAGDEPPATALERSEDRGATWRRVWTRPVVAGQYHGPSEVRSLGVLASGAVVLGLAEPNESLRTDGTVVVVDPVSGEATTHTFPAPLPVVSCDAAGACSVQSGDRLGPERRATFDGTTFGPLSPPVPRTSPGDATVFHDHHVVVRASGGGWTTTRDGRRVAALPAPPTGSPPRSVAQAPDGVVALFDDGTVWRLRDGRWALLVGAASIDPWAVAASGSQVLVAGRRGVARVVGGRLVREIRGDDRAVGVAGAPRTLTPRFEHLDVRGSSVVAWARDDSNGDGQVVRSTDGGRTWRQLRSLPTADDVQQLPGRTIVASEGATLLVSRDDGRSFRVGGYVDVGLDPGYSRAFVHFRSPREGVVAVPDGGAFLTRDGGRTFQALVRPGGAGAELARLTADGVITDGPLGTVLFGSRPFAGVRPTSIRVRITRTERAPRGRVRVTYAGRTRGVPAGSTLLPLTARAGGGPFVLQLSVEPVEVAADGTFRGTLDLLPGRRIRMRFGGATYDRPFRASALSPTVVAPERPRRPRR